MITAKDVEAVLTYHPETGVFIWKERSSNEMPDQRHRKSWNSKFAGREAGRISGTGYIQLLIKGKFYYAHRVAWLLMTGSWPEKYIDHINRSKTDNRLINLREATRSENLRNTKMHSDNRSGIKGVSWFPRDRLWRARLNKDGKVVYLKYFKRLADAEKAIILERNSLHGEFSCSA